MGLSSYPAAVMASVIKDDVSRVLPVQRLATELALAAPREFAEMPAPLRWCVAEYAAFPPVLFLTEHGGALASGELRWLGGGASTNPNSAAAFYYVLGEPHGRGMPGLVKLAWAGENLYRFTNYNATIARWRWGDRTPDASLATPPLQPDDAAPLDWLQPMRPKTTRKSDAPLPHERGLSPSLAHGAAAPLREGREAFPPLRAKNVVEYEPSRRRRRRRRPRRRSRRHPVANATAPATDAQPSASSSRASYGWLNIGDASRFVLCSAQIPRDAVDYAAHGAAMCVVQLSPYDNSLHPATLVFCTAVLERVDEQERQSVTLPLTRAGEHYVELTATARALYCWTERGAGVRYDFATRRCLTLRSSGRRPGLRFALSLHEQDEGRDCVALLDSSAHSCGHIQLDRYRHANPSPVVSGDAAAATGASALAAGQWESSIWALPRADANPELGGVWIDNSTRTLFVVLHYHRTGGTEVHAAPLESAWARGPKWARVCASSFFPSQTILAVVPVRSVGDGPPGGDEAQAPRYSDDPHTEQTEPCAGRPTTRCMQFYYARLAESRGTPYGLGNAKTTPILMTPKEAAAAAPLLQPLPDTPAAETLP